MYRSRAPVVAVSVVLFCAAPAPADAWRHTLSFENQTAGRVVQTVPELATNVKEVEFGDFDNDGDLDAAIAAAGGVFGTRRNKLYRNDGGIMQEVSGSPIIAGFSTLDLSRHLFFRDYNADGWLDLCVVNDDLAGGGPIKIYWNQHPGGVFSHFVQSDLSFQASCGGISADLDNDGDDDIYSGNYPSPAQDTLFLNNGLGVFSPFQPGTRVPTEGDYTIDVGAGDMNGDGKLDLLISSHSAHQIFYNDKNGEGDDGPGDYRYGAGSTGAIQTLSNPTNDGAMEVGDFNNDGLNDFYWTNKNGTTGDIIMVNTGNNATGMAQFVEMQPPPYGQVSTGRKIAVGDLNGDGRVDVVVGTAGRPGVFRNTSVNGAVSFVDWTPAIAFPAGTLHAGWHAGLFDTSGDGDVDIFLGGNANDHLFENVPPVQHEEDALVDGLIPNLYGRGAVAVRGAALPNQSDIYTISGFGANAFLSLVLNGPDDYLLEVLDTSDVVYAGGSIDRGGPCTEEAVQFDPPGSPLTMKVRVTVQSASALRGDLNGDGQRDGRDIAPFVLALTDPAAFAAAWPGVDILSADANADCIVDLDDVGDFAACMLDGASAAGGNTYILELLSRN